MTFVLGNGKELKDVLERIVKDSADLVTEFHMNADGHSSITIECRYDDQAEIVKALGLMDRNITSIDFADGGLHVTLRLDSGKLHINHYQMQWGWVPVEEG